MWSCPSCAAALSPTASGHRACAACGGVWFERGTLERHLAEMPPGPPATGSRSAVASRVTYRPCPACTRPMTPRNWEQASGVVVDVCGRDGVWLDGGELGALEAWVRSPRRVRRKAEDGAAVRQERSIASFGTDTSARASMVTTGWVEAAGELFFAAVDVVTWWD